MEDESYETETDDELLEDAIFQDDLATIYAWEI